jgi:hypothetical protein
MRGQQVPLDRFFSTAGGTSSGSRDRAIDAPQLLVDLAGVEAHGSQTTKNFVQSAVGIPRIEQIPHRGPGLIFLGQVAPGRSGPQYPQDCIDNGASIPWRSPGPSRCWKNIRNTVPFFIRKLMSRHPLPPWLETRHHFAQIPKTRKYQFSDKA